VRRAMLLTQTATSRLTAAVAWIAAQFGRGRESLAVIVDGG
jgi:hypothetical protein